MSREPWISGAGLTERQWQRKVRKWRRAHRRHLYPRWWHRFLIPKGLR